MLLLSPAARLPLAMVFVVAGTLAALADPPGRVGRLSYIEGTVSFHAVDQDQWSAAVVNYPVTSGASFWTEPASRAEIQIGGAELRLDQSTEVDVVRLDDGRTEFHVGQGVVNVHLHTLPPGGIHVITPHSEADLLAPGSYRVDAGGAPAGGRPDRVEITTLEGRARIDEPRGTLDIRAGESAVIDGEPVTFALIEASATPFDDWALSRERREVVSISARYVAPEVTGYEDLDRNGQWVGSSGSEAVWYPRATPAGWAPYRYGHWAFVLPWGWTWVDDAPWGFAPFHYGRWENDSRGWGWHPGERAAAAVYAPALVAFIGGAGWGVSISSGVAPAVGWVPLGRREVFHPYYATTEAYARNVNRGNVTTTEINRITINNVTNTTVNNYANRQAATVVPAAAFTRAAPVQQTSLALPRDQLNQARMTGKVDHLAPSAAARAGIAQPSALAAPAKPVVIPATIAKGVVPQPAPNAAMPAPVETAVPKAPGPGHDVRPGRMPAAAAPIAPAVTTKVPVDPAAPPASAPAPNRPAAPVQPQATMPHPATPPAAPPRDATPQAIAPMAPPAPAAAVPAVSPAPKHDPVVQQAAQPVALAPGGAKPGTANVIPALPHPEQKSQLTPTPKGWTRAPSAAPAPAPAQPEPQRAPGKPVVAAPPTAPPAAAKPPQPSAPHPVPPASIAALTPQAAPPAATEAAPGPRPKQGNGNRDEPTKKP